MSSQAALDAAAQARSRQAEDRRQEITDTVEALAAKGRSGEQIAGHLGMTRRALMRSLRRMGRSDLATGIALRPSTIKPTPQPAHRSPGGLRLFVSKVHTDAHRALLDAISDHADAVPCQQDPSLWWDDTPAAARACHGCPVITRCRAYGMRWERDAGVYGGTIPVERVGRAE
jgi:hypothetical protein